MYQPVPKLMPLYDNRKDGAPATAPEMNDSIPIRTAAHGSTREQILNWLTPDDCELKQSNLARDRVPGTGEWLLEREEYQRWKSGRTTPQTNRWSSANILWCSGKPGCGKSMLTCVPGNYLIDTFIISLPGPGGRNG